MGAASARIALITGSNRGIGLEIARQLAAEEIAVIIGARDPAKGAEAAEFLRAGGAEADAVALDVTDQESIESAIDTIEDSFGPIDILINNAAVLIDRPEGFDSSVFDMDDDTMRLTFETNVLGPARLMKAIVPGMCERGYGRVVNVSSQAGQLTRMSAGYPAYRISKAALNALTRIVAAEVDHPNVLINAMCPGWCRTEMGGREAERSPEQGAHTAVWLATRDDCNLTGRFFHDEREIPW
jgi:NAD(P)-dependent dehydrogenase (short-subunit alcohol dehydrogenase family)